MHEYSLKALDAIKIDNLFEAKMWYGCIVALDKNQFSQLDINIAHYMLAYLYLQEHYFPYALIHYRVIQNCTPDKALLPRIIPNDQERQLQQQLLQEQDLLIQPLQTQQLPEQQLQTTHLRVQQLPEQQLQAQLLQPPQLQEQLLQESPLQEQSSKEQLPKKKSLQKLPLQKPQLKNQSVLASSPSLPCLPRNAHLQIFSNLNIACLGRLARVSRLFKILTEDDTVWQWHLFEELRRANIPAMSINPTEITITKIYSLMVRYQIPYKVICKNARELFFNETELLFGAEQAIEAQERNTVKPSNANHLIKNDSTAQVSQEIKKFTIPEKIGLKNKLLAIYIKKNNCLAIMLLLDAGADIRLSLPNNVNALQLAAGLGHAFCLRILLTENAQQKRFEPLSRAAPIIYAAQHQHLDCLLQLVSCAIDYPDKSKAIVVMLNCHFWSVIRALKSVESKRLLVQTGTNLLVAVQNDDDALLKTFSDKEYFDDQIDHAFFLAVKLEKMKCLFLLAQRDIDLDLFRTMLFDVAATGNTKVAACLARTCLNADRKEAMKIAAKHRQILIIKTLLKSTDDIDFKISIILAAAAQVDREAMAPLLEIRDNFDYTVLHSASRAMRYRDVMALLSAGANPNSVSHDDTSIIEDMFKKQNDLYRREGAAGSINLRCIDIAELLLDRGAIITPSSTSLLIFFVTKEQELNQKPEGQQSQEQQLNPSSVAQQSHSFIKRMQFYFKCLFHPRHLGNLNRPTYLNLLVPILAQNQIITLQLLVEYSVHYLNINPNKRTRSFRLVDNLHERSDSPQKRFESPERSSGSPLRKPNSPLKNPDSPQRKPDSPLKSPDSPKSSLFSQQKKSESLQHTLDSPLRKSDSPQSRTDSSQKKYDSPITRMDSPQRKFDQPSGISNKPTQDDNAYYDLIDMCLQKGHFECAKLLLEQGISNPIKIKVAQLPLMEGIRELLIAKEFQQLVNLLPRLDAQQEQDKKQNEDQNLCSSASLQNPTAL